MIKLLIQNYKQIKCFRLKKLKFNFDWQATYDLRNFEVRRWWISVEANYTKSQYINKNQVQEHFDIKGKVDLKLSK